MFSNLNTPKIRTGKYPTVQIFSKKNLSWNWEINFFIYKHLYIHFWMWLNASILVLNINYRYCKIAFVIFLTIDKWAGKINVYDLDPWVWVYKVVENYLKIIYPFWIKNLLVHKVFYVGYTNLIFWSSLLFNNLQSNSIV